MSKKEANFTTKEKLYRHPVEAPDNITYNCGVDDAFNRVEKRVEFFFRYFVDILKFKDEQPELWKEYWFKNKHTPFPIWMAEYCFGDLHDQKGT